MLFGPSYGDDVLIQQEIGEHGRLDTGRLDFMRLITDIDWTV
jgi:hypothetical protein